MSRTIPLFVCKRLPFGPVADPCLLARIYMSAESDAGGDLCHRQDR